jgi:hypothetical protein
MLGCLSLNLAFNFADLMRDFLKLSRKFILEPHHRLKTSNILNATERIDICVVIFQKSCKNGALCHLHLDSLHSSIELATLFTKNFNLLFQLFGRFRVSLVF